MAKRLADGRADELLEGVMATIAARGCSDVKVSELASEPHCSVATLCRIALSKGDPVIKALRRWGDRTLERIEVEAARKTQPELQARAHCVGGAMSLDPLSSAFRADVDRFGSTRLVWQTIADRFIDRFAERPIILWPPGESER